MAKVGQRMSRNEGLDYLTGAPVPMKLLFSESKEQVVGMGRQPGTPEKGREKGSDSCIHLHLHGQTLSLSRLNVLGGVLASRRFRGAGDSALPTQTSESGWGGE